jgi:hypothetical protein
MERIGVPYFVVVEPQEVEKYVGAGIPEANVLALPFSNRGSVVPARNWIWERVHEEGHQYYWTFDDNIRGLFRLNYNLKTPVADGTVLRVIEDFAMRYENLPVTGCNYFMFAPRRIRIPPIYINNRVYSNFLLATDFKDPRGQYYRFEGRMNEDTDLSLRVLKDGNCTALFNAFLVDKMPTMTMKGGHEYKQNEDREKDARYLATKELVEKHPDVARLTRRFGRWHHYVDYEPFRRNKLRRRSDAVIPEGTNNYGMRLEQLLVDRWTPVARPIYGAESDAISSRLSGIDEAMGSFG